MLGRLSRHAETRPQGQLVQGWGYDDTLISDKRHLIVDDLDAACPRHPVFIMHVTAHLTYANSMALAPAGITPDTPHPVGAKFTMTRRAGCQDC